jgi:glycosyltransferase involved in cell wall biosynthesis
MKLRIAYMSLLSSVPSRQANSISMMNTCSQMAHFGSDVDLILPRAKRGLSEKILEGKSIWEFYGVAKKFSITLLPRPFFFLHPKSIGYTLLAVSYAAHKGYSVICARHLSLAYLGALYGKISIFESHDYLSALESPLFGKWIKRMRKNPSSLGVIVTTHSAAKAYEEKGIPPERMLVAPNGVNLERFVDSDGNEGLKKSLGLPLDRPVVGFSGHLYEGRGVEELLLCAQMLEKAYFLIVGGEPGDIQRCRAFAQQLGLSNVEFAGFVSQPRLGRYLLASDVLVMPYTKKTVTYQCMSPMKMFDYLACGRPIVATDFPVVREVLSQGRNAILVKEGSAKALAVGLRWLFDHPEEGRRLAGAAKRDAEKYSWKNRVRRILAWMRDIFQIPEPSHGS